MRQPCRAHEVRTAARAVRQERVLTLGLGVVLLEQDEPPRTDRDEPAVQRVDDDDPHARSFRQSGDQPGPPLLEVLERQPLRHPREPHEPQVA